MSRVTVLARSRHDATMRIATSALLALGLLASVPASADVTVHEPLPGECRGTQGAYGFWGEAWVGSGHTGTGPCYLHVHTPLDPPSVEPGCVEVEWDTGYTQFVCWGGADPECPGIAVGQEGPGGEREHLACVST